MSKVTMAADDSSLLHDVAAWVRAARSVVVLTGAGVSTASGIPDFRGPDGVWTRDPAAEKLSSIDHYMRDPDVRKEAWRRRIAVAQASRGPNAAHDALVALERTGHLDLLVTQNVDGLHRAAGSSPSNLIEVHGTAAEVTCLSCAERCLAGVVYERIARGDDDPHCLTCGGLLKSATVSFGQPLDAAQLDRAFTAAGTCDLFLAIGTSLTVYPVAMLPQVALDRGARLVIINNQSTPFDGRAAAVVTTDAGSALTAIVDAVSS